MKTNLVLIFLYIVFLTMIFLLGMIYGRRSCDPKWMPGAVAVPIFRIMGLVTQTPTPSPTSTASATPTPTPTPTVIPTPDGAAIAALMKNYARAELAQNIYYASNERVTSFLMIAWRNFHVEAKGKSGSFEDFLRWRESVFDNSGEVVDEVLAAAKKLYGSHWKIALVQGGLVSSFKMVDYLE